MAKFTVCSVIHTKQICCRQNVEFWNVKTAGTKVEVAVCM